MDFYNNNENITYPLTLANVVRRVGSYTWSDGFIVDCGFIIQGRPTTARLTRIKVLSPQVIFEFTFGTRAVTVAANYNDPKYTTYKVSNSWCDGYVVIGPDLVRFRQFSDTPTGYYIVTPASYLEPSCVQWLYNAFVQEITVSNRKDTDYETVLAARGITGDVSFSPGSNVALALNTGANQLEIRADRGGGTGIDCWPDAADDFCSGYITAINGSGPDSNFDFKFAKGNKVEVYNYPDDHKIVVDFTKGLSDEACDP